MSLFNHPVAAMLATSLGNATSAKEAKIQKAPRLNRHLSASGVAETILDAINILEATSVDATSDDAAKGTPPKKLNGSPVIGTARKPGYDPAQGVLVVMVKRGDADYVVATWSPALKTEWQWGRYCHSFAEACATFAAELPNGEPDA